MNEVSEGITKCSRCGKESHALEQPCYHCRKYELEIKKGLRWARITPLPSADFGNSSSPLAVLGELELSHRSYYWVVTGFIPLGAAIKLYDDPVGRDLIRVTGHCGCPNPREFVTWKESPDPKSRIITDRKNEADFNRVIAIAPTMAKKMQEAKDKLIFVDDPSAVGYGFIENYHIDGDLGLRVFVDILRTNLVIPPL